MRNSVVLAFVSLVVACAVGEPRSERAQSPAIAAISRLVEHELNDKALPSLSIVLVRDQEIVWAQGFGFVDPEHKIAATADTIYRVGSVSKLFTDLAVMQLVERHELDLDAPVARALPDFAPHNPFAKPITLRQLTSHRAGLVREPPVGHYFDASSPTLAATVASLNDTELVYEPETKSKYSNAGVAVLGRVLEQMSGEAFASYLSHHVLEPIGMHDSAFELSPTLAPRVAKARMWTYDGRVFDAPTFALGMMPAGSMYTSVKDLGKFLCALCAGGKGLVSPATLATMWTPQYAPADVKSGFGIGFHIGELNGRRKVGHSGAIYGFATALELLPELKLGVAVVATMDCANAVTSRIADYALECLLAEQQGTTVPVLMLPTTIAPETVALVAGRYAGGDRHVDLERRGDDLYLRDGEVLARLRAVGNEYIVDDRLSFGTRVKLLDRAIEIGSKRFERVAASEPAPASDAFAGLIGEYGWDHNTLFILERDAELHALIEWFYDYPLSEVAPDTYAFPQSGLYAGEQVVFARDASGRATQARAAGIVFPRRAVGTDAGVTFRIEPIRPVSELFAEARSATPPPQPDGLRAAELVELVTLDPSIKLDIRYATTNNFMSTVFYRQARALMQRPAAEALLRAHRRLAANGYGLLIHDAYRPWYVTKMFFEATPQDKRIFVADPAKGSRHNRGCAVDLTLYDLNSGEPVTMVSGYDEMSPRAYPDYPGGTSRSRFLRELLREAMEAEGFRVYEFEWWHFDHRDWEQYPVMNVPLGSAE